MAVGGSAVAGADSDPSDTSGMDMSLLSERLAVEKEVSRSFDRTASTSPSASPIPSRNVNSSASQVITTVVDLDKRQTKNAVAIIKVGLELKMTRRAMIIAVATALQECDLYNCASGAVPASLKYPHDVVSADHDSVGVFQQRPSAGWGTVANLMKPEYQARNFFRKLVKISGWQDMALTLAAQAVQVSAYPYAYAKHEKRATKIVNALL